MGLIRLEFGVEDGKIGVMQGTVVGTPAENKPKLLDQVRDVIRIKYCRTLSRKRSTPLG